MNAYSTSRRFSAKEAGLYMRLIMPCKCSRLVNRRVLPTKIHSAFRDRPKRVGLTEALTVNVGRSAGAKVPKHYLPTALWGGGKPELYGILPLCEENGVQHHRPLSSDETRASSVSLSGKPASENHR